MESKFLEWFTYGKLGAEETHPLTFGSCSDGGHIRGIDVSKDLGREEINELGRMVSFPVDIDGIIFNGSGSFGVIDYPTEGPIKVTRIEYTFDISGLTEDIMLK